MEAATMSMAIHYAVQFQNNLNKNNTFSLFNFKSLPPPLKISSSSTLVKATPQTYEQGSSTTTTASSRRTRRPQNVDGDFFVGKFSLSLYIYLFIIYMTSIW